MKSYTQIEQSSIYLRRASKSVAVVACGDLNGLELDLVGLYHIKPRCHEPALLLHLLCTLNVLVISILHKITLTSWTITLHFRALIIRAANKINRMPTLF